MQVKDKFKTFLDVTRELNKHEIIPILYGSLGLSRIIPVDQVNDIDIVIPNIWLEAKFNKLKQIMQVLGYEQDANYPHEFVKEDINIGFEPESELEEDINKTIQELNLSVIDDAKFRELTPQDYKKIYSKTLARLTKKTKAIESKLHQLDAIS